MRVETKRCKTPERRIFKSTGEALDYMIKNGIREALVTVETIENSCIISTTNTLSTDSMGYLK